MLGYFACFKRIIWGYLQLAILISHSCRSRGYNFRSIGHASVNDILKWKIKKIFDSSKLILIYISRVSYDMINNRPYTVQNTASRKDSNVNVWYYDVMKMAELFILEKRVRHPNSVSFRHGQIFQVSWNINFRMIKDIFLNIVQVLLLVKWFQNGTYHYNHRKQALYRPSLL